MPDLPGFENERHALMIALRGQRAHVLEAIDGLPDDALRRPVLPSGWTCLGLVQHLTLDVEIFPGMPAQNLRRTVLHVISETAGHAGHLDVVRELIDGHQWLVLT